MITGSFNFTKAAEGNNAENLLVIRDRNLAEIYRKSGEEHAKHSGFYFRQRNCEMIKIGVGDSFVKIKRG
jgi:phosphatidylserine/phosphatidylglycerophosphate/cardiolipin synthase-like enzyme